MTSGCHAVWTPERIAEARKRYDGGESLSSICTDMRVGRPGLRKILGLEPGQSPSIREKMGFERQINRSPYNDNEARYIRLRQDGKSGAEAREIMGISVRQVERFEPAFRAQTDRNMAYSIDATVPRFARHEEHLAAIKRYVGFDAVSRLMMQRGGA